MQINVKLILVLATMGVSLCAPIVHAQTTTDDKKIPLFQEDAKKIKAIREQQKKAILGTETPADDELDVKAPIVEFEKDSKILNTKGGVLLSGSGAHVQAEKGSVNTETKDAILDGDVIFTGSSARIRSEKAAVNLDDETGEFENAKFLYEEGGYSVESPDVFKLSETRYKLFDPKFTTCNCADGLCPWSLNSSSARITQEGYAHTWNTTLWFHGVPVFYTPYLGFPAKFQRSSGLLAPSFGYSDEDGFQFRQPIFVAIDGSTDLTVSPFTESKTRNGSYFDINKVLSKYNKIESRIIYSNEEPRGSDLRGSIINGLADPTIDTNRLGIYYNHTWRAEPGSAIPYRFITDIHHVSDGLMVKELADESIADPTSRYTTSTMLVRSALGEYFSGEVLGEVNETIVGAPIDREVTLNRLPEASLSYLKSFRPIPNPYGLRLVTKGTLTQTNFDRDLGYDGMRTSFNPSATIPFHISNYLAGSIGAGVWARAYNLNDTLIPGTTAELDDSSSSKVPYLQGMLGTAVERVYELPEGNALTYLTGLGTASQDTKLVRVKHTLEPTLRYTLVPDISQSDLPQFDQIDRINEKSFIRYGLSTSLYGRFVPRSDVATGIPEFTPESQNFPTFDGLPLIPDYGELESLHPVKGDVSLREGEIREIVRLSIEQGYDWRREYRRDQQIEETGDSNILPFTDITTGLAFSPTKSFGLKIDSYYNKDESRFTGWGLTTKIMDDRGDSLYARYSFVGPPIGNPDGKDQISQIDGGIETVLTERVRFGLYTRYDDVEKEPITNRMALRFLSACDCWHVDLGYSEKINPDKELVYVTFTFTGLGDISQDIVSRGQNGSQ